MEDYIYIILVLLWVVFSVVKATRKKPMPPASDIEEYEDSEQRPRGTFDEILEEFLGSESYDDKPAKRMQPIDQHDEFESFTPEIERYEELVSSLENTEDLIEEVYIGEEEIVRDVAMMAGDMTRVDTDNSRSFRFTGREAHAFELRKAIIYSAILHRPYD
jgi:hypothetical protein